MKIWYLISKKSSNRLIYLKKEKSFFELFFATFNFFTFSNILFFAGSVTAVIEKKYMKLLLQYVWGARSVILKFKFVSTSDYTVGTHSHSTYHVTLSRHDILSPLSATRTVITL